jgi:hypothetical protein
MRAARAYIRRFMHPAQVSPSVNFDPVTGTVTAITAAITFGPDSTAGSSQSTEVDEVFQTADRAGE